MERQQSDVADRIAHTKRACQAGLEQPELARAGHTLARERLGPGDVLALVRAVGPAPASQEAVRALCARVRAEEDGGAVVERLLLLQSALMSIATLLDIPVSDAVKVLVCEEVESWTRLDDATKPLFRVGTGRFVDMCMTATLRRFTAGQFDWVRGGLPVSYLLSVNPRALPAALWTTVVGLRGLAPVFFTHFGYRRLGLSLSEPEANRSYYRMAQSMALQPEVKGLVASSWFRSPDTHRVSPHLAWVNRVFLENGGFVAVRGPADPNCGVFVRSKSRRQAYERGEFTPTLGLAIWPRRAMLAWAAAHPEFG